MKIIDIAVKKVYRFNCPNCQSRLEADSKEVVDSEERCVNSIALCAGKSGTLLGLT